MLCYSENQQTIINQQCVLSYIFNSASLYSETKWKVGRLRLKCDGTRAETRFRLSAKRASLFKSAGASVQSTAGSRGVRISGSNAGYTTFRGSVRVLATHSIRQFPLHFPTHASPCAIRFQTHYKTLLLLLLVVGGGRLLPHLICSINVSLSIVWVKNRWTINDVTSQLCWQLWYMMLNQ